MGMSKKSVFLVWQTTQFDRWPRSRGYCKNGDAGLFERRYQTGQDSSQRQFHGATNRKCCAFPVFGFVQDKRFRSCVELWEMTWRMLAYNGDFFVRPGDRLEGCGCGAGAGWLEESGWNGCLWVELKNKERSWMLNEMISWRVVWRWHVCERWLIRFACYCSSLDML